MHDKRMHVHTPHKRTIRYMFIYSHTKGMNVKKRSEAAWQTGRNLDRYVVRTKEAYVKIQAYRSINILTYT